MEHPVIAVIVVSFNRGAQTRVCVDSILKYRNLNTHVYVVDNGSEETETTMLLAELESEKSVEVIRLGRNFGPAYARNRAIERLPASTKYVAIMDNDMYALPGWDLAASKALETKADLLQPKLLRPDLQMVDRGPNTANEERIAANPKYIGQGLSRHAEEVSKAMQIEVTGAGIYRKDVFDEIGLYDESLSFGEDYDLSFRAKKAGKRIWYEPSCEIVHDHRYDESYDQERGKPVKYLKSHVGIWEKHQKVMLSPAYLSWYSWLFTHAEPMYMPTDLTLSSLPNRLRRRFARWRSMSFNATKWASKEDAEKAVRRLKLALSNAANSN